MNGQEPLPTVRDEAEHPLAPYLFYPLSIMLGRLGRALTEALAPFHQLQPTEWRVLEVLARRGPMCGFSISALAGLDRATVSRTIRRLHDLGALDATPDPEDGRKILLSLTAAGQALACRARAAVQAEEEAFFAALSPAEREQLRTLLDRVLAGNATSRHLKAAQEDEENEALRCAPSSTA